MAAGTFLKLTAKRLAFALLSFMVCACGDGRQAGGELQGKAEDPALPVLGKVPDFALTDHTASPFGSARLDSGLWVANFIFTRCAATCPLQTATMAQLQERLKAKNLLQVITLVSFSVDPGFDTPEVLREYGKEYGADPDRWRFLTGSREEIWDLSKAGFKLGVGESPPESQAQPLFHSPRMVLVDGQRRIRGYYDGVSAEGLDEIEGAIDAVVRETP